MESKQKDGKTSWEKYAMYAAGGLVLGLIAWFGYKKFSSKTSTAAPGAAAGTTKSNASGHHHHGHHHAAAGHHHHHHGHHHAAGPSDASWDCQHNPSAPGCNPGLAAKQSWNCINNPSAPGCNPMLTSKKQARPTSWVAHAAAKGA